jgi:hypothetical protein
MDGNKNLSETERDLVNEAVSKWGDGPHQQGGGIP